MTEQELSRPDEILLPWAQLGGDSLLEQLNLRNPPAGNLVLDYLQAEVELTVQAAPRRPPAWNKDDTVGGPWKGVFSKTSFLVTRGFEGDGERNYMYRGAVGLILRAFPALYGLEPTYFLAYRFYYFEDIYDLKPKIEIGCQEDGCWWAEMIRNPLLEGFPDLPPIPPELQRVLELGGMACYHEDARSALELSLRRPEVGVDRKFRIHSQAEAQRKGVRVSAIDTVAKIVSRKLSRS